MTDRPERPEELLSEEQKAKRLKEQNARETMRERANSLLSYAPFREWCGDLMVSVGFFGEGREMTPYQQGARGRIVQEIEKLCEFADDGADFLAEVFKTKVVKGRSK